MTHTNRLADASSPYLLQHAHNPVDWYPWGSAAIDAARREDRPIFLSVGYSSCHWCHVMAHESFEDAETARLMNELFVNIKVDREERPDIDEIYMQAVQLFTGGHGGWPMSVFLTPELVPYYGGTYFPPQDRHGLPSFQRLLQIAADAYRNKRTDVTRTSQQVVETLQEMSALRADAMVPGPDVLDLAVQVLESTYDAVDGGFGRAPKFPHCMDISFLLRQAQRATRPELERMALHSLRKMARGGIYDQLGGGFHRYSTDARWLIPHFEKMLYDNALLVRTYVEAFQVTHDPMLRDVALQTLDYVEREMTSPEGGFYSAQDADSEGVEGRFFAWTPAQLEEVLSHDDARIAAEYFNVTPAGNFEDGASVLWLPRDDDVVAQELGLTAEQLGTRVAAIRRALFEARERRVHPGLDDKIIVAWNGLMISAFARAFQVWRHDHHLALAVRAAESIVERAAGGVFRLYRNGSASGLGYLDDHAGMIGAFIDLYEATFEPRWLELATQWNERVLQSFSDDESGAFFYTSAAHEVLIARSRAFLDNATPSGNSLQVGNLLRLGLLTGEDRLRTRAEAALRAFGRTLRQYPSAMAEMLNGLDIYVGPALEIALTGDAAGGLRDVVFEAFRPRKVVAGWPGTGEPADIPLLRDRGLVDGQAAAYVCRDATCSAPLTDPTALRAELQRG